MRKRYKALLTVSLILNVVLIGFLGGRAFHYKQWTNDYHKDRNQQIVELITESDLTDTRKTELVEKLKALPANNYKTRRQEWKAWTEQTRSILTAEKFDAQAYRNQLESRFLPSNNDYRQGKLETINTMVEIASSLSQDEREKMADIFRESRKNWHRKR